MMNKTVLLLATAMLVGTPASADATSKPAEVAEIIRETAQDPTRMSHCTLLIQAKQPGTKVAKEVRRKAVERIAMKLKKNDPSMLRARADAARLGLYGFPQNETLALRLYEKAKYPDAGMNAALMLYKGATGPMDAARAKRILSILQKSGASDQSSRGIVGAQSHYMAGLILESGLTGVKDVKKAFLHYRVSARNSYLPGGYHYLSLLSQSLPELSEADRSMVMPELRMMMRRWRLHSPDIMLLTGDMHAGKWLPDDDDGFFAQYHWRMAQRMGGATEVRDFENILRTKIRKMPEEKEKRLDAAVEAGMRNVIVEKQDLEFVDLCSK